MTKQLSFICLLLFACVVTQAQEEKKDSKKSKRGGYWTLRLAGGYAWPGFFNNETIMAPKVDPLSALEDGLVPLANLSDTLPLKEVVHGSYGSGMNFTLGVGYMVNPYFGVEMGLTYVNSKTYRCEQTRGLAQLAVPGPPPQYMSLGPYYLQASISTNSKALVLSPSIIVQAAKPGWKVYPYGRLGISLPVFGDLTHKVSIDADTSFYNITYQEPYFLGKRTEVTIKTEGTVSVGVNGAIGVAYRPAPFIQIHAEVNGQHLVTRAKSSKVTQWDADGNDRIADRGIYRTEFNFVDKLDKNSNNAEINAGVFDKDKPKDDVRPSGPFSNLGLNIGVTILLSKETLGKKKKD